MQENVAQANGYTWDKIVTSDGLEGYVANQYLNKDGESDNNKGDDNKNDNDKGMTTTIMIITIMLKQVIVMVME